MIFIIFVHYFLESVVSADSKFLKKTILAVTSVYP